MSDVFVLLVGGSLGPGIVFATVAGLARRRFGTIGLLAITVFAVGVALAVFKLLPFPTRPMALPIMPAAVIAAVALEWQVRRRARPVVQALWTTAAFTVVASLSAVAVASQLMIVA